MQKRQLVSLLGMHLRDVNAKLAFADAQFMANMVELSGSSVISADETHPEFRFCVDWYCASHLFNETYYYWYFDNELNCYVYAQGRSDNKYIPLDDAVYLVSFGDQYDVSLVDKNALSSSEYIFTKDKCAIKISDIPAHITNGRRPRSRYSYSYFSPYFVYGDGIYYQCPDNNNYRNILGSNHYLAKRADSIEVAYNGNTLYVPAEWQVIFPQFFNTCEECGAIIFSNNSNFVCSCQQVKFYGYHSSEIPEFKFHSLDGENVKGYFGAEVEFIYPSDSEYTFDEYLTALSPIARYIHTSHDSSLSWGTIYRNGEEISGASEGIEIVFHPMTWSFWKSIYPKIKKAFDRLKEMGAASHDTKCCGLHVHASKTLFDSAFAQAYPILILNGLENPFEKFSRRRGGTYCGYNGYGVSWNSSSHSTSSSDSLTRASHQMTNHSHCINYGEHSHDHNTKTVEFRIFKGTLDVDTLFASIELIKNVVEISNKAGQLGSIRFSDLIYGHYVNKYINNRISKEFNCRDDYYNNLTCDFDFIKHEKFISLHNDMLNYLCHFDDIKNKYNYYFVDYPKQKKLVDDSKNKLMLLKKYNLKFNILNDDSIYDEYKATDEYFEARKYLMDNFHMSPEDNLHDKFSEFVSSYVEEMKSFNLHEPEVARYANYILRKRGK